MPRTLSNEQQRLAAKLARVDAATGLVHQHVVRWLERRKKEIVRSRQPRGKQS